MKGSLISVITVLAVLAGCPENPTETAVDVVPAREDAAQHLNEARRDANEAVADAERCDELNGDDKTACFSIANATAIRDAAREERAERFDH